MRRGSACAFGLVLAAAATPAAAERLILSLSTNAVTIGSTYTGTRLVTYGIVERDTQTVARGGVYDLVVTVRGPREAVTIRRKEEYGTIWLNRAQQKFVQVPSFLSVISTRPITDVMDETRRERFRIGIDAIVNAPEFTMERGGEDEPFRAALVRLKGREQLYSETPRGVSFITEGFFRAPIVLPATAPVGNYDVEVALIADGIMVAKRNASFELAKTGIEEQVTEVARDQPLALGLATAGLSLLFGWFASVVFRRD